VPRHIGIHNYFAHRLTLRLMSVQDRTTEFKTCVDSIRNRSALGTRTADAKQRLIQAKNVGSKGEFSRLATGIGKEISSTNIKLNKLGQCV